YAQALIQIPTAAHYHSLNLAAAVQIICYELYLAIQERVGDTIGKVLLPNDVATIAEREGFYQQLEEVLIKVQFLDPQQPRQLMPRLRRFFDRAQLSKTELNIFRGMLRTIGEKLL